MMISSPCLKDGQKYYERLRTELQKENWADVDRILCELEAVCHQKPNSALSTCDGKFTTNPDELKFWLIDVARLMLEVKSASTRRLALMALEAAVPHLVKTNYQELPLWAELRTTISRDYTSLIDTARSEKDPNWHRMWAALVRVMNRDLCQGSSIINMFLSIVEAGFRSPELSIREQSFDCWRLLVEVFSNNKQMNLPKRMKLICIPLKSSKSKTEIIALKKFDIWWYLLNELRPHLDGLADTIFEPFIYFCFGPVFKPPLSYYFDDSFQEYGAPGKIYQAIKQLSAVALIHLLGPAPEVTKTLLISSEAGGDRTLPFNFPNHEMVISPVLFSTKAKLLIDACIECTVLFAQMKHLNYIELNRCLWCNLMDRINCEKTVSKNELLQRIKDVINALLRLCIKQENEIPLRELLYDTLLIIAKSELLTVNIGYDSPEQPMLNYKAFMSAVLNADLPCPANKSDEIVKHVFDLQKYRQQKGYWEILQKTVQYLCETNEDNGSISEFRTIRTQIYCHLASHLIVQIRDDPAGFEEHQSTVMSFLLYPLEYDQLVVIESVRSLWNEVYEPIALREKTSSEFTNTFCEMIKAMTIAKFAFNLGVVADFFCTVLRSLSVEFDPSKPPMKVFELFKDLTRKAQAYQANLNRVEKMIRSFREVLSLLSVTNMLTLILPIRNAINEMVSNENSLAMEEVKLSLFIVSTKLVTAGMSGELKNEPKEVRWNCKVLLSMLLELPADVKLGWKQNDMKKCVSLLGGKEAKTPTRKKTADEFVVIESNWQFKPEVLTEHQREKMLEKRTDIPALYNDMSQSQDSFVIKPWTPNKKHEPVRTAERLTTEVVSSSVDTIPMTQQVAQFRPEQQMTEIVVPDSEPVGSTSMMEVESKTNLARSDKENNAGNVLHDEQSPFTAIKEEAGDSETDGSERNTDTQQKQTKKSKRSILEQLRIDTVEGKTLDVMNLSRTRRTEAPELRSTRRKSVPERRVESERKSRTAETKLVEKSISAAKDAKKNHQQPKDVRSSRKLLNFENIDAVDQNGSVGNTSDDVIESSQTPAPAQSLVGKKMLLRRSRLDSEPADNSRPNPADIATEAPVPMKGNTDTENITAQSEPVTTTEPNNVTQVQPVCEQMEVDSPLEDNAGIMEASENQLGKAEQQTVDTNAEEETVEILENKQTRTDSASVENVPDQKKEPTITPLSPCRRSVRRASTDEKVIDSPANVCLDAPKSPKDKKNSDAVEKGTPSKMKITCRDFPVRVALQLLNSPKKNLEDEMGHTIAENCTGLSSPKVARYSPLVVLEPIKDYSAVVKAGDVAETIADKTVGNSEQVNSKGTGVDSTVENNRDGQTTESVDPLSPVKNLDEEMEPLNKSLNRSIVSSPDLADTEERNADLMNSTLNISPIADHKEECVAKGTDDGSVLAGSADRRLSSRVLGKERESSVTFTPIPMSTMSRRNRPSPSPQLLLGPGQTGNASGMKVPLRSQQNQGSSASVLGTPRSPSTHMINLGGRGAQLINLIRQSPNPNTPPQNASTPKGGGQSVASANRLMMRKKAIEASASASAAVEGNAAAPSSASKQGEENCDTSQYLVFSKVLPSPQASPAISILKRRHNVDDSGDDIESPINKRKRVSFHDPPVSATKEYIRQAEECRSPSISRCLQLATSMSSADKAKYMMRRRGKSDSISELKSYTNKQDDLQSGETSATNVVSTDERGPSTDANAEEDDEELTSSPESLDENQFMIHDATANMDPLQVTVELMDVGKSSEEHKSSASASEGCSVQPIAASPEKSSENELLTSGLRFPSEEAVLEHVLRRYALGDIVERYLAAGRTLEHGKTTIRVLTKELSSVMSKDPKTRHLVLDELSERHSVEFLEHAIQENSSTMVCERLSLTAMTDHIFKQLRSGCCVSGAAASTSSPSTHPDEKDNDGLQLVQRIYEKLHDLPVDMESNGQTLAMLRERFLKEELARKTRLEMMALLEDYFKASDR
ncbi:uncharacterized protein LOC131285117 [Anopheles ziemanni]|uniref:uncharacterized protein LOC131259429 n=1 Tax=Anopheles coustani TaxID=139045 RepID=UPI0026580C14|nr:uncharacterized protein LOC131259429 [Anopheles coustani]XP_058116910.1 uncharacterized protein LOC131259429 [Anopheles coustani]XP_058169960.1 uncharacterized protein LOC131285117 [Anopheles ziemanni]